MFAFGLIVGIVLGLVGALPILYRIALKMYNMSEEEASDAWNMLYDAAHDRESTLILVRDGEVEDEVTFKEQ